MGHRRLRTPGTPGRTGPVDLTSPWGSNQDIHLLIDSLAVSLRLVRRGGRSAQDAAIDRPIRRAAKPVPQTKRISGPKVSAADSPVK
ncbi:hypothetical protein GCM10010505_53070 [Kitasatospora aburaviensis]